MPEGPSGGMNLGTRFYAIITMLVLFRLEGLIVTMNISMLVCHFFDTMEVLFLLWLLLEPSIGAMYLPYYFLFRICR